MKKKWLYTFEVEEVQKVKETEKKKDESGQEVEVTREVEKPVKKIFKILNPTRKLQDESSIFYSVKVSEGIKMGLVTRPYLMRKFQKEGLLPSDEEKESHSQNYTKAVQIEVELESLKSKDLDESEKEIKIKNLTEEYENLRNKIFEFENINNSLFENTAEKRASDLSGLWSILFLLYFGEDGNESCVFGEGDFEQKNQRMGEVEESENQTLFKAVEKAAFVLGQVGSGVKIEDLQE
jgi:hypothetical protein